MAPTPKSIIFFEAQKRISILWFLYAGLIFMVILLQTLLNKFGSKTDEVWNWILPNLVPTLSIILTVFLAEIGKLKESVKNVNVFYFRLVLFLSLFYLTILFLIILIIPFISDSFIDIINSSNLYLAPLQGLVGIAIGFFFVKSEK